MPDHESVLRKAEAFAGVVIYLLGLVVCYGMVAFVRFDLDPTSWGAGGRFSYIAIGLIWTALFAEAQRDDAEQE